MSILPLLVSSPVPITLIEPLKPVGTGGVSVKDKGG
jgi:hypothetical protein